jgi:hypothetical protein
MGEVVRMEDWRKRKPKQDPLGRGKAFIYNPKKEDPDEDKTAIVEQIAIYLTESVEADRSIRSLPTVIQREQAAIKALELRMKASKYAKEHGFRIERLDPEDGNGYFNIIQVTK